MMISLSPETRGKQVGALIWRPGAKGELEVLLITSRRSRRWLIIKGWPIPGKGKKETALQEAFEESGIRGRIGTKPLGTYDYDKLMHDGTVLPCTVSVYALEATEELEDWPEKQQRERRWFTIGDAATHVFEPGLAGFLAGLVLKKGKIVVRQVDSAS